MLTIIVLLQAIAETVLNTTDGTLQLVNLAWVLHRGQSSLSQVLGGRRTFRVVHL